MRADEEAMNGVRAGERTTVVLCPDWPVVAIAAAEGLGPEPLVVLRTNRVVACSASARHAGVEVGLRRREAQRRCPELVVRERDESLEARRFEAVAASLDAITARVEIETPGWCSFATRGPSRYFGGDEAMSLHVVEHVYLTARESVPALAGVQVGTADTRFAALQAALRARPGEAMVVAPGATPAFLAPLPIGALLRTQLLHQPQSLTARGSQASRAPKQVAGLADLVHVLGRLGLGTLGDYAELTSRDVVGRFGIVGLQAHQRAAGQEERHPQWHEPPQDLETWIDLDPPVERVDQAAFIAKALADEFCAALGARGLTCSRVAVGARTEPGEELVRLWRGESSLSAGAIADRMRWQLDGWLSGSGPRKPSGGLVRLWLSPDQVIAATGQQLGFWGGQSRNSTRALRAVARTQGLLGEGSVTVAEEAAGRRVQELFTRVPAEAVDLAARGGDRAARGGQGAAAQNPPWSGRLPSPLPIAVHAPARPVLVLGPDDEPVHVSARGIISASPRTLIFANREPQTVLSWAGPWLVDERWWDEQTRSRRVHLQVVASDGAAYLLGCEKSQWRCDATYA